MKYLVKKTSIIFLVAMCAMVTKLSAQSAEEAYELYSSGVKSMETKDYPTAISNLDQSLKMYDGITDLEGVETIKESAKQALAQAYYAYGMSLYQDKDFDNAIVQFKNAETFSKANNNPEIAEKANDYIGRVSISKAGAAYTDKNYDEVISFSDEALKIDPNNEMGYFWRGRAYKEKDDLKNMKADLDKCMELTKDDAQKEKTYSNAAKIAGAAFMSAGADAMKAKKYNDAISNLETATSYPEINANAYYYLAVSYNALSKWNDAVTAANQALSMELKDPSATNFELGKAYEGLGKKAEACAAYKKVTAESYKKAAEYQMQTVLKCN